MGKGGKRNGKGAAMEKEGNVDKGKEGKSG